VVPERVQFSIDLRHPDAAVLTRLGDAIAGAIAAAAAPCTAHTEELSTAMPSRFDAGMQDDLARLAQGLGLAALPLLSMAGHDSRFLATICPSAMVFIPCLGGVTHHPAESITPADALAGAMLAAAAMARWSA
jgi:N-carbamoyl-L-amino-acid hydrolase